MSIKSTCAISSSISFFPSVDTSTDYRGLALEALPHCVGFGASEATTRIESPHADDVALVLINEFITRLGKLHRYDKADVFRRADD